VRRRCRRCERPPMAIAWHVRCSAS
jgi:hypothetical protein